MTIVFACMATAAVVFVYASAQTSFVSRCDAVLSLAGRSVLSEFDLYLNERYGIFGFYSCGKDSEDTLQYYINAALNPLKAEKIRVDLSKYSLTNVETFSEQIINTVKFQLLEEGLDAVARPKKKSQPEEETADRVLRNKAVINSLPSRSITSGRVSISALTDKLEKLTSLSDLFQEGTDTFYITQYALHNFDHEFCQSGQKTFFQNEVEYILYGELSDKKNKQEFRDDFTLLRTGLNLLHIYADAKKKAETYALAEILTPGPQAIVTQAILAAGWAFAEAENDAALLFAGQNVAIWKTPDTWATQLQGGGTSAGGYLKPLSDRGNNYGEYLQIFLYFTGKEIKLARMMDLIQLNLKGCYNSDFLLRNYNAGLEYSAWVKGEMYAYEQKY